LVWNAHCGTPTCSDGIGFPLNTGYDHILSFLSLLKYPHLILASSTDVERAFSAGGLTVSKFRHSLSDESIRASSILGSWFSLNGAIPCNEIAQLFKDKLKRPKKRQKVDGSAPVPEMVFDVDNDADLL
jgi:hypothetical protein